MPEPPHPRPHTHPYRLPHTQRDAVAPMPIATDGDYVELHVTSNFTFLSGASHPDELVRQAATLGHRAAAITDVNSLAGVVRAHVAARDIGIALIVGCRLILEAPANLSVLVYPTDRAAYGRLCQLLTLGKRRAGKGGCRLTLHDLLEHQRGLLAIAVPPAVIDANQLDAMRALRDAYDDDRLSVAASCLYGPDDAGRLHQLAALCACLSIPGVATNDVHYHAPQRRPLQDVLTCIRRGCTLDEAGLHLHPHAERHLKSSDQMRQIFADQPAMLRRTLDIARRATGFSLDQLRYEYPDEVCPPGLTPMRHLAELTRRCALERYPAGVPLKVCRLVEHELKLIDELGYAPYFLTVHDLVVFARSRGILCQGRGAAANSAVCYCLGVTAVDPDHVDTLFERFVSRERNEPPDIDIDFEHERREEVIQYLYAKYGRDRAALTAEVITYRSRSAVRDIGKAMGLSLDAVDRLARNTDWWDEGETRPDRLRDLGFDPDDPTMRRLAALVGQIQGFPRHLSQHVGGFVITRGPLCDSVPIENAAMPDRTVIEWDKDDIDAMGMLKVDVLGLGMLTCIRKCFDLIERHRGATMTLAGVPPEDPAVYNMICRADTVGVFQIESRAQMSMLPRLRPACYYDQVIEVAIVPPGPIQGDMVHPYLRRRSGQEPVTYPSDAVRTVLGRTLGVPLFQEQAMALAITAAGFTPGEADQLRRAIAAWKSKQKVIYFFGHKLIDGMVARGYGRDFAERCFEQIKGFSEYGFPESHAASFALLVYVSAWLKHHEPAAFAAALINSQPMGFYAPAQIVRDARQHGVAVRPIDVNRSRWDCTLEDGDTPPTPALRLGMRLVSGLSQSDADSIAHAVSRDGPFASITALWRASGVGVRALRRLAAADAFNSMDLDRQHAHWQIASIRDRPLPLFERAAEASDDAELPPITAPRQVMADYATVGLSLKSHPIAFIRRRLDRMGVTPAALLADPVRCPQGTKLAVAGLVLVRQRPSTAKGVVFMTIEDETGIANLILYADIYDRCRKAARHATIAVAHGVVQRQGQVVHVMARRITDLSDAMADLIAGSRDFH